MTSSRTDPFNDMTGGVIEFFDEIGKILHLVELSLILFSIHHLLIPSTIACGKFVSYLPIRYAKNGVNGTIKRVITLKYKGNPYGLKL